MRCKVILLLHVQAWGIADWADWAGLGSVPGAGVISQPAGNKVIEVAWREPRRSCMCVRHC
jgi:hypothetical protein